MRTIKFRGRDRKTGKWFYGNLYDKDTLGRTHICTTQSGSLDVIPETVGQFTGLYDKNGKEIYEGDVLKYKYKEIYRTVYWDNNRGAYFTKRTLGHVEPLCSLNLDHHEIVGNLFDEEELK